MARTSKPRPSLERAPGLQLHASELIDIVGSLLQGPNEAAESLVAVMRSVDLLPREPICQQGQAGDSLFLVQSGGVLLTRRLEGGRRWLLVQGRCQLFEEHTLLAPGPRWCSATAMTRGRVAELSGSSYTAWRAAYPTASHLLIRVLASQLQRTNQRLLEAVHLGGRARLRAVLMGLAVSIGVPQTDGVYVPHGLTQAELGGLVGYGRDTVNRMLHRLAACGSISVAPGAFVIHDFEVLLPERDLR